MVSRRSMLAGAVAASVSPYFSTVAKAATPSSMIVIAKQIDDITSGFDPAEVYEVTAAEVTGNVYRTLVTADPSDAAKIVGDLAETWTVSSDGKRITFRLRKNVLFESGNAVTAQDVIFSLQRVVKLNKAVAYYFTQFGWTAQNVETLCVASDPYTVELTFPIVQATGMILGCLADTCGGVVEKAVAMAKQTEGDYGNAWLRSHSAGAGAYSLTEWRASERIVLTANPHSSVKPAAQRIVIRHVADAATQLLLVRKGDVDIARNLGSDQLKAAQGITGLNVVHSNAFVQMYLGMNMDLPQFKNAGVRQAIKYAVDYDGIAKNITPNAWYVSQSFLPQGMAGALPDQPFKRDVAKAKSLLTQAGFANGFSITLDHYASSPYAEIAQAIQADLSAVGIEVQLQAGETSQVTSRVRARQHQMALGTAFSSYLDPSENASQFCSNADDGNDTKSKTFAWRQHFSDPKLTADVDQAARELDPKKRMKLYDTIQKEWLDRSPFAMLLQQLDSAALQQGVSGFVAAPLPNFTSYARIKKS
jgi:peptide/nickel transport system substrate-binding protein